MKRITPALIFVGGLLPLLNAATTTLIERGEKTEWRFLDDGTEPAATWNSAQFDDAQWKHGRSPLGYGEPEIRTPVSFGPNESAKYLAAYFRREFELTDHSVAPNHLIVDMRIDDGVIVYLNGREVIRHNMPAGQPTVKTRASVRVDGAEERIYSRYVIPATSVQRGRNVLAAEVHQFNAASSDLFLDLQLTLADELPPVQVAGGASAVTLAYLKRHYVPPEVRIPDGFIDGGRGMKLAADGTAASRREILVVDRLRDSILRRHLDYVRWLARANLPADERAALLAQYVDLQYSPDGGRDGSLEACEVLLKPHLGKEVLIGEVMHAGVCRHRALVFKLLADEAGLQVALVRGNLGKGGAHTWNELIGSNGEKRIVDVMNPTPGYRFPKTTDRAATQYLTVDDKPYYVADAARK